MAGEGAWPGLGPSPRGQQQCLLQPIRRDPRSTPQLAGDASSSACPFAGLQGVKLHCIIDACHSGSVMDLAYQTAGVKGGHTVWEHAFTRPMPSKVLAPALGIQAWLWRCRHCGSHASGDTPISLLARNLRGSLCVSCCVRALPAAAAGHRGRLCGAVCSGKRSPGVDRHINLFRECQHRSLHPLLHQSNRAAGPETHVSGAPASSRQRTPAESGRLLCPCGRCCQDHRCMMQRDKSVQRLSSRLALPCRAAATGPTGLLQV